MSSGKLFIREVKTELVILSDLIGFFSLVFPEVHPSFLSNAVHSNVSSFYSS